MQFHVLCNRGYYQITIYPSLKMQDFYSTKHLNFSSVSFILEKKIA